MKLYLTAGACSLASHIVLQEIGKPFDIETVDLDTGQTQSGLSFTQINPKGYVPALELDDGAILTEGAAILQHLSDTHPDVNLAPKPGTIDRARMLEQLTFISSELHKSFVPLFSKTISESQKEEAIKKLNKKLDYVEQILSGGRKYLVADQFTIVDAYLFVVTNWCNFIGIDLKAWPHLAQFVKRISERPATQAALSAEGLI